MCVYACVCVCVEGWLSTPLNNWEKGDGKEVTIASRSSHEPESGLWVSLKIFTESLLEPD